MPGRDEGEVEVAVMERAAGVAGIDFLHPMGRHMGGELVHGDELGPCLLADAHGVAGVVLMPVGERHMGHALGGLMQGDVGLLEGGVAGKKGIDQDAARAGIDTEAGMAEPRDLHALHPLMRLS